MRIPDPLWVEYMSGAEAAFKHPERFTYEQEMEATRTAFIAPDGPDANWFKSVGITVGLHRRLLKDEWDAKNKEG